MDSGAERKFDFESYLEAMEDAMEKVREASFLLNNVQEKLGHFHSRPPSGARKNRSGAAENRPEPSGTRPGPALDPA